MAGLDPTISPTGANARDILGPELGPGRECRLVVSAG